MKTITKTSIALATISLAFLFSSCNPQTEQEQQASKMKFVLTKGLTLNATNTVKYIDHKANDSIINRARFQTAFGLKINESDDNYVDLNTNYNSVGYYRHGIRQFPKFGKIVGNQIIVDYSGILNTVYTQDPNLVNAYITVPIKAKGTITLSGTETGYTSDIYGDINIRYTTADSAVTNYYGNNGMQYNTIKDANDWSEIFKGKAD